jgi:mevalonate kinase
MFNLIKGLLIISCCFGDMMSKLDGQYSLPLICAGLCIFLKIFRLKPGKAVVTSQLPMGSGLGSSASFCVALSSALIALSEEYLLKAKEKKNGSSFEKIDLELVTKWAFEGERIIHGKPSGIDNTVITFGTDLLNLISP